MKTDPHAQHNATHCPNCGARLGGAFCQGCGQAAQLHVPSAREFLHEFIAHYVALEGKLWKSLALLLFRPGRLTRDYIEGRRARYVEPLRLYLSFSIIFFAIFKLGGVQFGHGEPAAPAGKGVAAAAAPAKGAGEKGDYSLLEFDGAKGSLAHTRAAAIHPALGKKVEHFSALPREERNAAVLRSLSSYAPYAIFALMPVFAALLKLLYLGSGQRYGEHVLFALHTNAFAFLILGLLLVLPSGIPFVGTALFLWLVFYLPTAMRKVYGGSRRLTAVRWIVLMSMHLCCLLGATVAAAALAVLA